MIDPIEHGLWSELEKWALREGFYTPDELLRKRKELDLRLKWGGQRQ